MMPLEIDITKLKVRASHKHAGTFYSLCNGATDTRLFAGSSDYSIHVFDPTAEKLEPIARWVKHDNYVSALVHVACDAKEFIVSGSYDRQLVWWGVESGEPIRSIEAHQGWIRDLIALPGGSGLVSVGDDMVVKVWDARSGELVRTLEGHAKLTPQGHVTALYVIAVTPDGKYLASGDRIGEIRVWEAETGKLAQSFQVPILYTYDPRQRKRSIGGVRSLAFSPDGKQLAVGGIGQIGNVDGFAGPAHVELWDWQKPQLLRAAEADGHKAIIQQLRFHPAGPWLVGAGGGDDGLIAFWKHDDLPADSQPAEADKPDNNRPASPVHRLKSDLHIHRFCFNRASTELFVAGHGKLDIWSSSAG
jgi:WD40 repeat protein